MFYRAEALTFLEEVIGKALRDSYLNMINLVFKSILIKYNQSK